MSTTTPAQANGRKPARKPDLRKLTDLESRLLAALVAVPAFTLLFWLSLPGRHALLATAVMWGASLLYCAAGWVSRWRSPRPRKRARR